jgi:hypothetical protein
MYCSLCFHGIMSPTVLVKLCIYLFNSLHASSLNVFNLLHNQLFDMIS